MLLTMLPEYLHRIQAGASLLMRICGLYQLHAVKDALPVFFIVATKYSASSSYIKL